MSQTDSYAVRIRAILRALGIPEEYRAHSPFPEATDLVPVGVDIHGRSQQLQPRAAAAWQEMKTAAQRDGITLQLVSAFRSVEQQREIIERKLAAGRELGEILRVNAAPGYSEHHTGCAVDVTDAGSEPLTEAFEQTRAFGWLCQRAHTFGFTMTYPRNNTWGIDYEPWHWTFQDR